MIKRESLLPVSDLLLADSAGLLLCDDTFDLLVEDPLLLHLETHDARSVSRDRRHSESEKPSENAPSTRQHKHSLTRHDRLRMI